MAARCVAPRRLHSDRTRFPRVGRALDRLSNRKHQPHRIGVELAVVQRNGLPSHERTHVFRKLRRPWRRCAVDEDRKYLDAAPQRGPKLDPDEIVLVVQSALAVLVLRIGPIAPDECNQDFATFKVTLKQIDEVLAGLDTLKIDEDTLLAELTTQALVQRASVLGALASPVADENLSRHLLLPLLADSLDQSHRLDILGRLRDASASSSAHNPHHTCMLFPRQIKRWHGSAQGLSSTALRIRRRLRLRGPVHGGFNRPRQNPSEARGLGCGGMECQGLLLALSRWHGAAGS